MKKLSILMSLFVVLAFASACNKDEEVDNGGDNGNEPDKKAVVVVNELMTKDTLGLVYIDGQGDGCDWVELYNKGEADLDIGGYFLADDGADADEASQWEIPSDNSKATTIKPGEYMVIVWGAADASGADIEGIINDTIFCPKGLSTKKDVAVALFDKKHKLVDASEKFNADGPFGKLEDGKSLGREGKGTDTWKVFDNPTPGKENK